MQLPAQRRPRQFRGDRPLPFFVARLLCPRQRALEVFTSGIAALVGDIEFELMARVGDQFFRKGGMKFPWLITQT